MSGPDPRVWQAAEALWEEAEELGVSDLDAFLAERSPEHAAAELFRRLWQSADAGTQEHTPAFADVLASPGSASGQAHGREGELIDRFRLIRVLGEGGAGVVYLAEEVDQDLHHQVALKLLHQRYGPDDPTLTQSLHERRLLARLTHPGITR